MSDFLNLGYSELHLTNLAIHILAGSLALGLGIAQYFTKKGSKRHIRIGKIYSKLFALVLLSAIFGLFAFGFRAYLAALTLSASYAIISAIRVIRIKESGPRFLDNILSILFCAIAVGIIALTPSHLLESPLIVFVTLGNVILLCAYDLARNISGVAWLKRSWLNEHIYKMIGSHSALITAATGNMARDLQPWSIIIPTQICFILIIFFIIRNPLPRS